MIDPASEPNLAKKTPSVARSAGITTIAIGFSRIAGVVREQFFAYFFGAGFLNDVFQLAFRIPNLLRDLVAEGALSTGVQKVFQDYDRERSTEEAWKLFAIVLNVLVVFLSIIVIIGILLSGYFVDILAVGFDAEKSELAVLLTRIMFPFILLISISAIAMAVLNTRGYFGMPQSASTVFNVTSIISGLGFAFWLSGGGWTVPTDPSAVPERPAQLAIIGMALGTLVGGVAQLLFQLPLMVRTGFRLIPAFNLSDPGLKRVISLSVPAIIGNSAPQVNILVNTVLISGIAGGLSWLGYSFRLFHLPIGLFAVAIVTATLPLLNDLGGREDRDGFRRSVSSSMNLIMLLMIPASVGLIVLGEPIMRLLYAHGGAFKESDVQMTALALAGYAVGMTAYGFSKLLTPAFTSLSDSKTPMKVGFASIVVNVIVSYSAMKLLSGVWVSPERPDGLAHVGVALGASLVIVFKAVALMLLMRHRVGGIEGRSLVRAFVKISLAAIVMAAASYGTYHYLHGELRAASLVYRFVECIVPVAVGGAVFAAAAKLLGVTEIDDAVRILRRKSRKS